MIQAEPERLLNLRGSRMEEDGQLQFSRLPRLRLENDAAITQLTLQDCEYPYERRQLLGLYDNRQSRGTFGGPCGGLMRKGFVVTCIEVFALTCHESMTLFARDFANGVCSAHFETAASCAAFLTERAEGGPLRDERGTILSLIKKVMTTGGECRRLVSACGILILCRKPWVDEERAHMQ